MQWKGRMRNLGDKLKQETLDLIQRKNKLLNKLLRPAIHLSQNTQKWMWNAKNKTCIVRYFMPFFSLFAFHSIFYNFDLFIGYNYGRFLTINFITFASIVQYLKFRFVWNRCILSECSDRATHMIPHSWFLMLALSTDAQSE